MLTLVFVSYWGCFLHRCELWYQFFLFSLGWFFWTVPSLVHTTDHLHPHSGMENWNVIQEESKRFWIWVWHSSEHLCVAGMLEVRPMAGWLSGLQAGSQSVAEDFRDTPWLSGRETDKASWSSKSRLHPRDTWSGHRAMERLAGGSMLSTWTKCCPPR